MRVLSGGEMANKGIHSEDPSEGCQTRLSGVPAGAFVLACLNENPVISKLRDHLLLFATFCHLFHLFDRNLLCLMHSKLRKYLPSSTLASRLFRALRV